MKGTIFNFTKAQKYEHCIDQSTKNNIENSIK